MSQHEHLAFAPPVDPGLGRAWAMALLVHFLLILALTWGVTWRNQPQDVAVEAELWSSVPEPVAQRNAEPLPVPAPTEIKPETPPKPVEPVKPPSPSTVQPAPPDKAKIEADIAIDKQKKKEALERERQADIEKKAAKAKEEDIRLKEASAKKAAEEKEKKAVQEREEAKRLEERKHKEEETKHKEEETKHKEEEIKRKEEEAKRLEEETKRKEETAKRKEEEAKEKKETEERRQEQIKRLKGLGETSTGPTDKASAAKASAPSGTYLGRLRARVKPNITFPDSQLQSVKGNPEAEVEVTCSPTGEITSKKLIRSSDNPAWDEAVLNAIEKTGTLPRDESGNMPPKISFGFRPRD